MLVESHDPQEHQISNALAALWTIEEGLRAYNADKIYANYIDIVKQYIKGQRDIVTHNKPKGK
tara:strand:+ start:47 stop:235 length:189 start_codon:yes stop_codon:yes gene_type:complete